MGAGDPAIRFQSVGFTRPGGLRVLDGFDLDVSSGEVIALVGRSGAGKTTLLKLVNRMLVPQSGTVSVEGRDTREWDPIRLRRRRCILRNRALPSHERARESRSSRGSSGGRTSHFRARERRYLT